MCFKNFESQAGKEVRTLIRRLEANGRLDSLLMGIILAASFFSNFAVTINCIMVSDED